MIFDCCYEVHFGANWLLKFDSPPQFISSLKPIPKPIYKPNQTKKAKVYFAGDTKQVAWFELSIHLSCLTVIFQSYNINLKKFLFVTCH